MGQFYGDRMYGKDNQYLVPNQVLCSREGRFTLRYQTDGNLVIYDVQNNKPIWSTNTYGKPVYRACMQDDGNFVVYSTKEQKIWDTKTSGNSNSIIMQDDGNLVVYDKDGKPIWASDNN